MEDGNHIGRTLKIDRTTSIGTRGNYARSCVEVDLTKQLLAKFKLRRRIRRIMYEGLHLICFHCGWYSGHKKESCPHVSDTTTHQGRDKEEEEVNNGGLKENQNSGGQEAAPVIRSEVVEAYGQWMVAKKAGRKISKISDSREISRPRNLRRFPQKARSESDLMEGNKEINGAKGSRFNFLREDNVEIIMAEKANNKYQGVDVNSGK